MFLDSLILAFIQGVSEWFPISSSGHLVLFSWILNYANTIQFDVALHFGTLMAVFVYFGKDIVDIIEDIFKGKWKSQKARLGFLIAISSIPAGVAGYLLGDLFERAFSSMIIVAVCFGITAIFLFIASLNLNMKKNKIGYKEAFFIGVAQAFAIFPGVSRAGATISSGILLGVEEKEAVRFSFLMSIPVIFGAGVLKLGSGKLSPDYLLPTLVAFVVGLITIHFLLKILVNGKKNLRWFAWYCLILSLSLLGYLLLF